MSSFPQPNFNNTLDLFIYAQTVTDDLFGPVSLITIWLVAFIYTTIRWGPEKAFPSATFITFLLSVLFYIVGWIAEWVPLILIIGTLASLFFTERTVGY